MSRGRTRTKGRNSNLCPKVTAKRNVTAETFGKDSSLVSNSKKGKEKSGTGGAGR